MTTDHQPADDRGLGRLAADLAFDSARLVRLEIDRAKAEVAQQATRMGMGIGMVAGAVFLLLVAVPILVASLVLGLAEFMAPWLSALVVGGLLLVVASVLASIGARSARRGAKLTPTESIESAREDLEWLTRRTRSRKTSTS